MAYVADIPACYLEKGGGHFPAIPSMIPTIAGATPRVDVRKKRYQRIYHLGAHIDK
jgi:hypothetical protein